MTADVLALLDQLDQAREKATPGPWTSDEYGLISGPDAPADVDHWIASGIAPDDQAAIVAAVNALPALTAALRAALDLHVPLDRGTGPQCQGCATRSTFTPWPCPTATAITTALEGTR